ncbi:NRPS [Rhinocladiella similis]
MDTLTHVLEKVVNCDSVLMKIQNPNDVIPCNNEESTYLEALLLLSWCLLLHRGSIDRQNDNSTVHWGSYPVSLSSDSRPQYKKTANLRDIILSDGHNVAFLLKHIKSLCNDSNSHLSPQSQDFVVSFATQDSSISGDFGLDIRRECNCLYISKPEWATLLSPSMAQFQIQAYADILEAALNNQQQTIADLTGTLGGRELTSLWRWNSAVPPAISQCMHEIIGEKMAEHPGKIAVTSWDGELTYGQLDSVSSYLSERLIQSGVGRGTVIPLCFEKSMWTVVALLAVMRAGGTFVLTDPQQPESRLSTIVSEVDAQILITSEKQATLGARIAQHAKLIVIGPELLQKSDQGDSAALKKVPATTILYIIFTSGSTGKPKGVMISHENFTTGAIPRAAAVGYKPHSRVLDFPSYAFDVSIDCMLCTLANGGCICVPSDEQRVNDLSGAIQSMDVNMAHMTPSVARVLSVDDLTRLEVLGLGGESLSPADAAIWSKLTKIIIAYGPSECTVGCTINNEIDVSLSYTSIGRGIGGLTWIVDPDNHDLLTPVGAVGELLIEGSIVGLGYLKDPDRTRQVFIDDPKWLVSGSGCFPGRHGRLYKTGDLVKYDPAGSGNLVFVGRKDRQVKIRGQRVELSEVEYHLGKVLPQDVSVAAEVITPGGEGREPSLVAFLSEPKDKQVMKYDDTAETVDFSEGLLRSLSMIDKHLASELPAYMVPTAYIPLRNMPLLVSCKVDRKRLQEIGLGLTLQTLANFRTNVSQNTEPKTEVELALQNIWSKLLVTETDVHVNDNFFALGGDSLKAMKLVAAARLQGFSLTVAQIFANPTLSRMASTAERVSKIVEKELPQFSLLPSDWPRQDAREEVAVLCKLKGHNIEDIYPCTPLQEGLMALSAKVTDSYIAQRVVHLTDLGTAHRLRAALEATTLISPILRTRIVQVPSRGLVQVVVRDQLDWFSCNNLENYLRQDRESPMQLGDALARFGLVVEDDSKVQVVFTIHHALYDGWMMPLIISRVNRAYQGLETPAATPFKNFIRYILDRDHKESEAFWAERLRGASGLQFPVVPYVGYQVKADSLLEYRVEFHSRPASNTTVATAIRAAWGLVAARYTSSEDVVYGETLTGRNAPVAGIWEMEGPLITTVPMRLRADRSMLVSEYLQSVHEQTILRIPHEHMGLQNIRRLNPDALRACELRTGLVLHPNTDEEDEASGTNECPANGFVPVNDREAAQEALKFNSYALMLVCALDKGGFLTMASFDANTVDKLIMQKVLEDFGRTVQELCEGKTDRISDLSIMKDPISTDLYRLSQGHFGSLPPAAQQVIQCSQEDVKSIWLADPANHQKLVPLGAVGEVLLETAKEQPLTLIDKPQWLCDIGTVAKPIPTYLYETGHLGKYQGNGQYIFLGPKGSNPITNGAKQIPNCFPKAFSQPDTGRMGILSQIWSRILNIPKEAIDHDADFFALGGDSIGAMKLVSEARMENMELTVAQVFEHRHLSDMAHILREVVRSAVCSTTAVPFQLLDCTDLDKFISEEISPTLVESTWKILDVVPCLPMQEIAVRGTTQLPRFSARYELFYLEDIIDRQRLFESCQELVSRNEILRTIFTTRQGQYYGVVLERLDIRVIEYAIEGDLESFVTRLCDLDVQTKMPEGTPFIKFFFVQGEGNRSCLVMRISHAQYDEICLPRLLHQLAAVYEGIPILETVPFSHFVNYTVRENIPESISYWRHLLRGSSMTTLRPELERASSKPAAVSTTIDLSGRLKTITAATLPAAAWALCLARRLCVRDVTFGEVVSGRNVEFPNCYKVMGPTWQYVPVRVKLEDNWTGSNLLEYVQQQHIDTSRYEGIGFREIARDCTDWPETVDWFDSVVHQDVEHVENLSLLSTNSRMDTYYPHLEPLREWKIQTFHEAETVRVEIVTFEDWLDFGTSLLNDLGDCFKQLVDQPDSALF